MKPIAISTALCAAFVSLSAQAEPHGEHGQQAAVAHAASAASGIAAPVQPVTKAYSSPLATYRTYAEPPVSPWLDANARVARKGGWKAYAREASQHEPDRPSPGVTANSPERVDNKPPTAHGVHAH